MISSPETRHTTRFSRAGWSASVGPIVTYSAVAVLLLLVGALFLGEHVGWRQVLDVALCLAGIALVTSRN